MTALRAARPLIRQTLTRPSFRAGSNRVIIASTPKLIPVTVARTFTSTRVARSLPVNETDEWLAGALKGDIDYEVDQNLKPLGDWRSTTDTQGWTVKEDAGGENYTLEKTFGQEVIKISVRSCDYAPAEEDSSEGVENSEEGAEEIEEPDSIPAHLTFTKPGTSDVLWVEGLFEDQVFVPVKIQVLDKAVAGDVAESERPDMEHGRVNQYQGPEFESLHDDVLEAFNTYFQQRGLDALGPVLKTYCSNKEMESYVQWGRKIADWVKIGAPHA